jgi:type I restriction enzyme M protein
VIEEETITVEEALGNLKTAMQAAFSAEDRLKELLIENGLMEEK